MPHSTDLSLNMSSHALDPAQKNRHASKSEEPCHLLLYMAVASCSSRCCWLVVLTVFSTQLVVDTSFIDDNLLSSYSFHRRECLDREFVEEPRRVTGNLRSFEGRTTCLNGNGVRAIETDDADSSFRITSTRNASHLISELANSVEVR